MTGGALPALVLHAIVLHVGMPGCAAGRVHVAETRLHRLGRDHQNQYDGQHFHGISLTH
jgi:hypothetical protein